MILHLDPLILQSFTVYRGWKATFPHTQAAKRYCWMLWKVLWNSNVKSENVKYCGYRGAQINLKRRAPSCSVSNQRRVNCSLGSMEEQFQRKKPWNVKEQNYQNRSLLTNGCLLLTQSKCRIWSWVPSLSVYYRKTRKKTFVSYQLFIKLTTVSIWPTTILVYTLRYTTSNCWSLTMICWMKHPLSMNLAKSYSQSSFFSGKWIRDDDWNKPHTLEALRTSSMPGQYSSYHS